MLDLEHIAPERLAVKEFRSLEPVEDLRFGLVLMACLAVLLMTERAPGPNPAKRAGRPFEAVCLVALAGAVAV